MHMLSKVILIVIILHWNINKLDCESVGLDNGSKNNAAKILSGSEVSATPGHVKRTRKINESARRLNAAVSSLSESESDEDITTEDVGSADLKALFVKYDTDDGNICLLDNMKQEVFSWTYPNGTLRAKIATHSHKIYLDLSYSNISKDEDLLQRTRSPRFYNYRKVEAFSAAYNALSAAPFKTLSLMGRTLKYLTLQGNKFAALNHDVEAIEQYIHNGAHRPINTTQRQCDELLARNDTEIYEQECSPYSQSGSNTESNVTSDMAFEDYLRNLHIQHMIFGTSKESIAWATFPKLPQLLELDISNCSIEYLSKYAFKNVSNLRKLFVSHNKILRLDFDSFNFIRGLQYLDLSFMNVLNYNYQLSVPTIEVILNLVYGLKIHQNAFKALPDLIYLDLSHSKITRNSAVALAHLGKELKFLSLCYTSFPMISNGLFKNTSLEGLDLSGNPFLSYNIVDDAFDGIGDTLRYLVFEHSNLKEIGWLHPLRKLEILGLAGNNINALTHNVFESLVSLQVLDLSSNHIGNWYTRVLYNNSALKVLNIRGNNINMLTVDMLKDFEILEYLSLGDNNFLCNCMLREVVELASNNNKQADCSYSLLQYVPTKFIIANLISLNRSSTFYAQIIKQQLWQRRFVPLLTKSFANIRDFKRLHNIVSLHFLTNDLKAKKCATSVSKTVNDSTLKFQLLDYDAEHYWCFNETDRMKVDELNCQSRSMDYFEERLQSTVKIVTAVVACVLGVSIISFIIYLKRWHIHYYYASFKSAALLSRASKESLDKFHHLNENNPSLVYDIFISYCQNDRSWVLDELLPNVEQSGDISICLHERDFQIGVTILDNIISCMDRSRSLMLLISSNFLLSHWCQFEMYLAQHRIFEMSKEHLILVFLEDVPRSKRPKTLQYLMDIKTYIKWPSRGDKEPTAEERKLFWKRVTKSLELIGIGPKESKV